MKSNAAWLQLVVRTRNQLYLVLQRYKDSSSSYTNIASLPSLNNLKYRNSRTHVAIAHTEERLVNEMVRLTYVV